MQNSNMQNLREALEQRGELLDKIANLQYQVQAISQDILREVLAHQHLAEAVIKVDYNKLNRMLR